MKQAEAGPLDTPAAPAIAQALRMLERMAAQNSQHDVVMDYKARFRPFAEQRCLDLRPV